MPLPSAVMMADVAAGTLKSSAANATTAVNGASAGTLTLKRGEGKSTGTHQARNNKIGLDGTEQKEKKNEQRAFGKHTAHRD